MIVFLSYEQVDMKNITEPMKNVFKIMGLDIKGDKVNKLEVKVSPNEFTSQEDTLGFLPAEEIEPYKFLTFESSKTLSDDLPACKDRNRRRRRRRRL